MLLDLIQPKELYLVEQYEEVVPPEEEGEIIEEGEEEEEVEEIPWHNHSL